MIRANGILMTRLLIHTAQTGPGGGRKGRGSTASGGDKAAPYQSKSQTVGQIREAAPDVRARV